MKKASTYLEELVSRYRLPAGRTRCIVASSDHPAEEIARIAQENDIGLIVVAGGCGGWLQRLAEGGVCHRALGCEVCPVLSVPQPEPMPAENTAGRETSGAAALPRGWSGEARR